MGHTRDLIVIGAAAGGVEALGELVAGLPPDLPAAVLVALHTAPRADDLRARLAEREAAQLRDARVIRQILLGGSVLAPADVPSGEPAHSPGTKPVREDPLREAPDGRGRQCVHM